MADVAAAPPQDRIRKLEPLGATEEAELSRVATLHERTLPHTASSRSGPEALVRMYRALLHDPGGCVLLADEDDGEGGYAAGTLALRETERVVQRALSRSRAIALRMAYRNLLAPWHVAARLSWEWTIPRERIGYVLTIGATPGSKVRGMALLATLERDFAARGARESWVDTESSNERACRFYARAGYAVASRRFGQVLLRKALTAA